MMPGLKIYSCFVHGFKFGGGDVRVPVLPFRVAWFRVVSYSFLCIREPSPIVLQRVYNNQGSTYTSHYDIAPTTGNLQLGPQFLETPIAALNPHKRSILNPCPMH